MVPGFILRSLAKSASSDLGDASDPPTTAASEDPHELSAIDLPLELLIRGLCHVAVRAQLGPVAGAEGRTRLELFLQMISKLRSVCTSSAASVITLEHHGTRLRAAGSCGS